MPDSSFPSDIQHVALTSTKLACVWTGLYFWEIAKSLQFERDLMLHRRAFRWPVIPYLVCRYSQLVCLVCYVYVENMTKPINCTVSYFVVFSSQLSIVAASVLFALRTMAIWTHRLVTICLWAMIAVIVILVAVSTAQSRTKWSTVQGQCLFLEGDKAYTAVVRVRVSIMAFDAAILLLAAYKLLVGFHARGNENVVKFIFGQGLSYFVVAFVGSATAVAFLVWKPNHRIGMVVAQPATLFTSIAACRSVRSLEKFMARRNKQKSRSTRTTGRVVLDTVMSDVDI